MKSTHLKATLAAFALLASGSAAADFGVGLKAGTLGHRSKHNSRALRLHFDHVARESSDCSVRTYMFAILLDNFITQEFGA